MEVVNGKKEILKAALKIVSEEFDRLWQLEGKYVDSGEQVPEDLKNDLKETWNAAATMRRLLKRDYF